MSVLLKTLPRKSTQFLRLDVNSATSWPGSREGIHSTLPPGEKNQDRWRISRLKTHAQLSYKLCPKRKRAKELRIKAMTLSC